MCRTPCIKHTLSTFFCVCPCIMKISIHISLAILSIYIIPQISCRSTPTETCSHEIEFIRMCPHPIQNLMTQNKTPFRQSDVFISLAHHYQSPEVPGCNFYKSKAALGGVHVSSTPFDFSDAADKCSHNVKFLKDSDAQVLNSPICRQEIGMRLMKNGDVESLNVFLWHNFTVYQDRINFTDTITNYNLSKEAVACSHTPKFVQLVIITSVDTTCTILIQQYEILGLRNYGCDYSNLFSHQFCGIYSCAHTNYLIERLKLLRKVIKLKNEVEEHHPDTTQTSIFQTKPENGKLNNDTARPPRLEPPPKSMAEIIVTAGFPIGGLVLMILGFYCLRKQYSKYKHECKIGINVQRDAILHANGRTL